MIIIDEMWNVINIVEKVRPVTNEYNKNKTYIECESDIKKSLLYVSEILIKLLRESEGFVEEISIQISNTVDDTRIEMREEFNILKENFNKLDSYNQMILDILWKILEKSQKSEKKSIVVQEEKFQSNKKDKYLKIWNGELFLHSITNKRFLALKDVFIMPQYYAYIQINKVIDETYINNFFNNMNESVENSNKYTIDTEIIKYIKYKY